MNPSPWAFETFLYPDRGSFWEKQPPMDRHLLDIHHSALGVASMVTEDSFSFPACLAHKTDVTKESSEKM